MDAFASVGLDLAARAVRSQAGTCFHCGEADSAALALA